MPGRVWHGKHLSDLTQDEKIEFLVEWCENLTQQLERHGNYINDLHSRLRRVEDRIGPAAN
jgi:hypothetical protein